MLSKVISGGQTGVDRAGLDAAIEAGIPVGGYYPKGRRSEDGTIPESYPFQELTHDQLWSLVDYFKLFKRLLIWIY